MSAVTPRTMFSGEELIELMSLLSDADSAELKVTVPEEHQRSTIMALGLDPLEAQIRQVLFFDTPDLALDKAGVVVRARRIQGRGGDSVVKLRPVVPSSLPEKLRRSPGFRVEVDALPGGFVCSGTLKGMLTGAEAKAGFRGELPIRKLFSKEQRRYYAEHAPEGLTFDDLTPLGPIFILKLRMTPSELRDRLVFEMWMYPDGSRILEISTRCATGETFQVAAEVRAFLARYGIDLSGEQQTKTRKALSYFAGEPG
ncbi:adenylate cyclase [Solirubrobacter soli]|uniref:adenylate cyclase n=1 Tax=Solirubrobacter soli TaxID=363832 RepID=UPI0012F7939E|nr:adenylate cyclase [Solirubrobacter soli]